MQTHAVNLIHHLTERGYPIEVITYQPAEESERRAVDSVDRRLPCPIHRTMSRVGYQHNLHKLEEDVRRFRPDLIYASTIFYGGIGSARSIPTIARSVGNDVERPWIVYPYAFGSHAASHPALEQRLYKAFRKLDYPERVEAVFRTKRRELMVRSARLHTRVLANSRYTLGLLEGIGMRPDQLEVVVGGVDHKRFSRIQPRRALRSTWGIPEDRFLLVTVCRLVPKKGIDFLIRAMTSLQETFPDIHLLVVGTGRKGKKLRKQAQHSAARDRITFAGSLCHDAIDDAYSAADAFVLASRVHEDPRTGLRDAETMGRVLLEANSAGLPVIAARSGGIPSVIEHGRNGLLFTPDDLGSLATQLETLRSNAKLRESLVDEGRQLARDRFDWPVVVDRHEAVFEACLSDRPHV